MGLRVALVFFIAVAFGAGCGRSRRRVPCGTCAWAGRKPRPRLQLVPIVAVTGVADAGVVAAGVMAAGDDESVDV